MLGVRDLSVIESHHAKPLPCSNYVMEQNLGAVVKPLNERWLGVGQVLLFAIIA